MSLYTFLIGELSCKSIFIIETILPKQFRALPCYF